MEKAIITYLDEKFIDNLKSDFLPTLFYDAQYKGSVFIIYYGKNKQLVKSILPEIVNFSGLYKSLDNKVYQFSSGMLVRLIFSATMTFIKYKNPRIVLLGEVFNAGGDLDFQQKALKKMNDLIMSNICVIIASHDLNLIKNYSDRTLWIKDGKLFKAGSPT